MGEDVVLFIARQRRVGRASAFHGYAGPKPRGITPRSRIIYYDYYLWGCGVFSSGPEQVKDILPPRVPNE